VLSKPGTVRNLSGTKLDITNDENI